MPVSAVPAAHDIVSGENASGWFTAEGWVYAGTCYGFHGAVGLSCETALHREGKRAERVWWRVRSAGQGTGRC